MKYSNYAEVPFYQKQWFFWITYFTLNPIAVSILLFSDIYYERSKKIEKFGILNKIVVVIIVLPVYINLFNESITKHSNKNMLLQPSFYIKNFAVILKHKRVQEQVTYFCTQPLYPRNHIIWKFGYIYVVNKALLKFS